MAELKDTVVNGSLSVNGSANINSATVDGSKVMTAANFSLSGTTLTITTT